MWSCALIFILFHPVIWGHDSTIINFSMDYFKNRDVKSICLITSKDNVWQNYFVKEATNLMLMVSIVKDGSLYNTENIGACLRQKYSTIGVLLDPNYQKIEETIYYASKNNLFDSTRKWLLPVNNGYSDINDTFDIYRRNTSEIINVFENVNISVDADIFMAVNQGGQYELYDIYNFGKIQGGGLIVDKLATWTSENGFNYNLNEYKYYRRWNFQQWPMRMIVVVSPMPKDFNPKMLTDLNPTLGVASITKTGYTILKVISDIHNLRFIHSIADRWIGDFSLNKSKAVVSSSLYYKQQDISAVLRFNRDIYDKIDMVHPPLTSIETRYYYRIPTHGAGKLENQFLRPLSTGVWFCVIGITALCALVLLCSSKAERRPSAGQYAIFSVIASICQQFFDENTIENERVSTARKLTILVTGISCVLIYNYYTSSVVSWLLNGPPPSINSLQELLVSPLDLIFEDIGYTRSWLQTPNYYYNRRNAKIEDDLKKKVFSKKKDMPLLMSVEQGIKMVKAGGYAYHTEVDNANRLISKTFTQSELCELGSLQSMEKTVLYPCLQKNSPYKEFFVWSLIRLLERGIVKCIQQRTASPTVECEGSSPRALALGGAAPAFLLLAGGFLLATIIMLFERFIWRCEEKAKIKKTRKIRRQ